MGGGGSFPSSRGVVTTPFGKLCYKKGLIGRDLMHISEQPEIK